MEDEEKYGEVVGEYGGVKVGAGEWESGAVLKFLKVVLITNFWTFVSTCSLFSNKGFEYIDNVSLGWAEVDGNV